MTDLSNTVISRADSNNAIMLKVNLNFAIDPTENRYNFMQDVYDVICKPFLDYLEHPTKTKPPIEIYQYSLGFHENGKSKKPHVHMNLHTSGFPNNVLTNYKYWYLNTYLRNKADVSLNRAKLADILHAQSQKHFKRNTHSIKCAHEVELKGLLAYPFKECVDESKFWKAYQHSKVAPFTLRELITYGAGIYITAIRERVKYEEKEEKKLEKWGEFCAYMDALLNTPTQHEMGDLRGVTLIALDYTRSRPERTSVNAVITMCKDYCFKRGIWTNQQILDKYQIV